MNNQKIPNPFTDLVLDAEEQALEMALERGEYEVDSQLVETRKMLAAAATRYLELNTSKPITIRVNQLDLIKVKAKAVVKNVPYQTLLGALIHQYAEGEKSLQI